VSSKIILIIYFFNLKRQCQLNLRFLCVHRLDENRNFTVDPSENRFFKFTFPPSVKQVMVRSFATSSDNICLTVAVQKSQVSPSTQTLLLLPLTVTDTDTPHHLIVNVYYYKQCPVFDPINNVNGFRQSMSNQSYMIVQVRQFSFWNWPKSHSKLLFNLQKEDYGSSFYLVYMVNPDNKTCASRNKTVSFVTSNNTHKNISLTIKTIVNRTLTSYWNYDAK